MLGLLLLAAVACVVPVVDGVRQGRAVLWSATRGAVQLLAVGLLLGAVFRAPLAVLPVLAVMVAAAAGTVAPRLAGLPVRGRWRRPATAAAPVTSSAAVTGLVVFATGALPLGVRNLVAVGGITVGGAMTPSTLAGRRFLAELGARRAEVEGKLALGATMPQATADLVTVAVAEALVPALDTPARPAWSPSRTPSSAPCSAGPPPSPRPASSWSSWSASRPPRAWPRWCYCGCWPTCRSCHRARPRPSRRPRPCASFQWLPGQG